MTNKLHIKTHRVVAFLLLSIGSVQAQSLSQRMIAPISYELGFQPAFQSNPLNLSELEIDKTASDDDYLNGIGYSSSNVVTFYGKLNYSPRLIHGRKTRFDFQMYQHFYYDIPERNYASYSLSMKQSLGDYRYLNIGYWILPRYYLRNYNFVDPASLLRRRQETSFGTDKLWLGFQHRLGSKNKIDYRLIVRQELYLAPFSHYDMNMQEAMAKISSSMFKPLTLSFEFQYGLADNANDIDDVDRSYHYLNLRPSLNYKLFGKHRLSLSARYDQRAYSSEQIDDPLHAGRYQEEYRLEASILPKLAGPYLIEPFVGYRERQIHSSDPVVRDLKSYSRFWFGIRFGFKSVIDMYF